MQNFTDPADAVTHAILARNAARLLLIFFKKRRGHVDRALRDFRRECMAKGLTKFLDWTGSCAECGSEAPWLAHMARFHPEHLVITATARISLPEGMSILSIPDNMRHELDPVPGR